MTRFLLKLTLIMTLGLTITSLAARALGSTQPSNPTLRGFIVGCEGKPQPCWYGIVPGLTGTKLMQDLLVQYRYPPECVHLQDHEDIVISLELWPCAILPPLYFGDAVSQFGSVEGVTFMPSYSDVIYDNSLVVFKNRFVSAQMSSLNWVKDRFKVVVPIRVFAEEVNQIDLSWYGNIPRWRLCQLEPQYYVCGFCSLVSDTEVYDTSGVCK